MACKLSSSPELACPVSATAFLCSVSHSLQTDTGILCFPDPNKTRVTKTIIEEVVDGKVVSSQVSSIFEVKIK